MYFRLLLVILFLATSSPLYAQVNNWAEPTEPEWLIVDEEEFIAFDIANKTAFFCVADEGEKAVVCEEIEVKFKEALSNE